MTCCSGKHGIFVRTVNASMIVSVRLVSDSEKSVQASLIRVYILVYYIYCIIYIKLYNIRYIYTFVKKYNIIVVVVILI